MMKKIFLFFLLIFIPFFFVASINAEDIRLFQSIIKINKDGTITVSENITYDFGDLYKHGIYRDIPVLKTNSDGKKYQLTFSDFSVVDGNKSSYRYQILKENDNFRLKIGDPDRTITGEHDYLIGYKVSGALTYFSDHDELYWNVTGNQWPVAIDSSTVKVQLPENIDENQITTGCFTGSFGSIDSDCLMEKNGHIVTVQTNQSLSSNQGLTAVVGFPKNIVAVLEPKEVINFWDTLLGKLVGLIIKLLLFIWYVGLPLYIIYRWKHYGRDPKGTIGVTSAWFDPPRLKGDRPMGDKNNRFLTPGEVGTLGDETADLKDVSATIVDLARRGYLIIDERKKNDFYLIKKKNIDDSLLPFEQKLIGGFFGGKKEIRIKDEELYQAVEDAKSDLYDQVVADGLFPKSPDSVRKPYYILAFIALVTGNIFLAIIAFIFGRVMPRKTVEGVDAFNIAKSLKNFLTSQDRQLKFQAEKQLMFEKLLPYAIVYGVEKVWAKRFKDIGIQPPSWYRSYSTTNFNSLVLVNSLSSSMKTVSSAATPTRSSSGFSSGFSGGSSGGGGGGGGGGSW